MKISMNMWSYNDETQFDPGTQTVIEKSHKKVVNSQSESSASVFHLKENSGATQDFFLKASIKDSQ